MIRFLSIAANTFTQTVRQPITAVLIAVTFGVLVGSVPLAGWTMDTSGEHTASDQKMLLALGVSTLLVAGLLLSAFSASAAITREIADHTALTVISKPVSRATFVLGKFAGVAAVVTVGYYLTALAYLLTVRHGVVSMRTDPLDWPAIVLGFSAVGAAILVAILGNLLFGWTFTSAAIFACVVLLTAAGAVVGFIGANWSVVPFGEGIPAVLPACIVVTFLAVGVFTAVAVAASTRLGQVMTLLVCGALLIAGYMHRFLFADSDNPAIRALGWLLPNLRLFDTQEALVRETDVPWSYVGWAAAYAALYVAGVLAVAAALFQRRSLEAPTASSSLPAAVNVLAWCGRAGALAAGLWAVVTAMATAQLRAPAALAVRGGVLIGAAACWALWSVFARGAKWSYWVVLTLTALATVAGVGAWLTYGRWAWLPLARPIAAIVAVVSAAVLIVLLLPKTRLHFQSAFPRVTARGVS